MANWVNKTTLFSLLLFLPKLSTAEYYNLEIDSTGVSHLIILQDSNSLYPGWEFGVFDLTALLNTNNCDNEIGELLVGHGTIPDEPSEECGNTLCLSAIGSIDLCDIGGEQIPGFVEGSPIEIRVWDPVNNIEYSTFFETNQSICSSDTFSGLCTSIVELTLDSELRIKPIQNIIDYTSSISIFPNPAKNHTTISVSVENYNIEPLKIFDLNGRLLQELIPKPNAYGLYEITWNTGAVPPGIYFIGFTKGTVLYYSKFLITR